MKKTIVIILLSLSINATAQQITKVEIMATGLTCSMCSNAINKQLKTMSEVDKVDIDLNKNLFVVTLKSDNKLTPKAFKDKVEKAGFFVGSMVLFMKLENVLVQDNKQYQDYVFIDSKEQTLNGLAKMQVLDKGFVTAKEYKKLAKAYVKYPTYNKDNANYFHLKLI